MSAVRPSCWASGTLAEDVMSIARQSDRWSCGDAQFSIRAERVLLRFEIRAGDVLPKYLLSRRSALEAVHVLAIDEDGAVRRISLPGAALESSMAGGYFKAALPDVTPATRQIIAAIDLPSHEMTLERAYLAPADAADGNMTFLLVLAGLAGMLVTPMIFNAALYRALHESFVLWHSVLTFSLLMTILVSSALSVVIFDPPAMTLSWITTVIFGMAVGSGAMFTYSFIEPGRMHPHIRRLLPYCAAWALFVSAFHAAFPFVARPIQSDAYTAAFGPVLVVFILAMIDSLRRGSRAAKFQAMGYSPMILVGLIRLVTGVVPWLHNIDAMLLFYVGCMCEVFFTTLGVADRFVSIKRERDRARDEADMLERLSETDSLTGLSNRRAIERQFEQLKTDGFSTLAILDLDHFKSINDTHGHSAGDAVLKAVAHALQPTENVRVYRLGGEEFMMLLRNDDAHVQAEFRRQAIPSIVANMVAGLEQPVTASMGLTVLSATEGFAEPYERADKLLYEAKSGGRNRTRALAKMPQAPAYYASDRAMTA